MSTHNQSEIEHKIISSFRGSIDTKQATLQTEKQKILKAAILLFKTITAGNKIMSCGNGGSAADSQHFVAELVNRFEMERAPIAAISLTTDTSILTAISNDYSYNEIFSKQVQALGNKNDVLVAISTSGNSENILTAVSAAKKKNIQIILLTGITNGSISKLLTENDIIINVQASITARIQETHILIIHCLCQALDLQISQIKEEQYA
jgi:D-sedoheptulose 7-phosphate isomerase